MTKYELFDLLGLDPNNPQHVQGVTEAALAILHARHGGGGGGGQLPPVDPNGNSGPIEIEIDPDLDRPTPKNRPNGPQPPIDIEDPDKVLDQIKNKQPTKKNGGQEDPVDPSEPEEPEEPEKPTEPTKPAEPAEEENDDEDENEDEGDGGFGNNEEPDESDESDEQDESDEPDELDDETNIDPEEARKLLGNNEDPDTDDENNSNGGDGGNGGGGNAKKSNPMARRLKRARVLKAAKETLEKARANGAPPAQIAKLEAAIKQLEALEEALHIDDISDQEFNHLINDVIEAMDAIDPSELSKTTDAERQQRAERVKADMTRQETVDELTAEEEAAIRKERREMRAKEQEKIKNQMALADRTGGRAPSSFKGFEAFVQTLYKAIARQVKNIETTPQTWTALPRRTPGPGVLKKGTQRKQTPDGKIPVLRFYFDCSFSWKDSDIQKGLEALKMLRDFERQGKLVILERYFSNNVFDNMVDARNQGGTCAWEEIVQEVKTSGAENVVIMTDYDMHGQALRGPTYMVPGFVWYLWKDGVNSQELPQHLYGRNSTYQFSFNA